MTSGTFRSRNWSRCSEARKALESSCPTDPRDGSLVVFHKKRAKRPHDNTAPPEENEADGSNDPIVRGETTRAIDVAPLSEGFTFINKNLFPVLFPFEEAIPSNGNGGINGHSRGMHFLQWTSSYFDRDWHNMAQSDREVVMERLARLEQTVLCDPESPYPVSGERGDGSETRGYFSIIKNCGRTVGGSLAHGHQQMLYGNVKPQHFADNEHFAQQHDGTTFSEFMQENNSDELAIKDYGPALLTVPYFMKRPYNAMLLLKDTSKQYLFECDEHELSAVARAWGETIQGMRTLLPQIGRQIAYNVTVSTGPGAGIYFEFLPYTQETGGFEQLGLWVCQDDPKSVAESYRKLIA